MYVLSADVTLRSLAHVSSIIDVGFKLCKQVGRRQQNLQSGDERAEEAASQTRTSGESALANKATGKSPA